jgi:hypothetical protein
VTGNVGEYAAVLLDRGWPHVFYLDRTHGNLRQAWLTGAGWRFVTLDGVAGSNGRLDGDMGRAVSAVNDNGAAHVYYYDATRGNLRQAYYDRSRLPHGWRFGTLDGAGGSFGRVDRDVGSATGAAPGHVFYRDDTRGDLRHAWFDASIRRWRFTTLDGAGGTNGRINGDVGTGIAVTNGATEVYYRGESVSATPGGGSRRPVGAGCPRRCRPRPSPGVIAT